MTAPTNPPTAVGTLAGTQAPSQIEFLWERYRSLFWVVITAVLIAIGGYYALGEYKQSKVNQRGTAFATALKLDDQYTSQPKPFFAGGSVAYAYDALSESLKKKDLASLESLAASADPQMKPWLLFAVARRAMMERQWDRAEAVLREIETSYPNHSLVKSSDYPLQVRDPVRIEKPDPKAKQKPEFKPAKAGSEVAMMREQIAAERSFAAPARFAPVAIPADAKRVKFQLSNGSSFVIALMADAAPKHVESFLKLAAEGDGFWKGLAVDEIQRPTEQFYQPRTLHIGFESTKSDDRTKWITTEPSKHVLEFEANNLSHHPGAVAGRPEADGKSCADRFWIAVDDGSRFDGERVVFGYVVEGLDTLRRVCEESMSAQEEQSGRGRPTSNIRVDSVTIEK